MICMLFLSELFERFGDAYYSHGGSCLGFKLSVSQAFFFSISQYDNILMEEAAQILEIETFIPLLLQVRYCNWDKVEV